MSDQPRSNDPANPGQDQPASRGTIFDQPAPAGAAKATKMQERNAMAYAVDLSQENLDQTLFSTAFEGGDAVTIDMELDERVFRGMDLQGCLMFGIPAPAELMRAVPKRLIIERSRAQQGHDEYLPDFGVGPWGGFHLVSEAFVDIVEGLEPTTHQFLRIEEVTDSDRNLIQKKYYLMNISTRINAVDIGRSSVRVEERERTLRGVKGVEIVINSIMDWIPARPRVLVLKRDVISEHHLWRGTTEDIVKVGFSDTLFRAVHSEGLSPLDYLRAEEI